MRAGSRIEVIIPPWVGEIEESGGDFPSDEARMRLAIALARRNAAQGGGPFGAAVFEKSTGKLIAAGVNLVLQLGNSMMHAEMVALMLAEQRRGNYSLAPAGGSACELVTSCEPCAMCLGAVHWSGVSRLVCGATRDDVENIGFEEGPVGPESYRYLEDHGVEVVRQVCRNESQNVLADYARANGVIY